MLVIMIWRGNCRATFSLFTSLIFLSFMLSCFLFGQRTRRGRCFIEQRGEFSVCLFVQTSERMSVRSLEGQAPPPTPAFQPFPGLRPLEALIPRLQPPSYRPSATPCPHAKPPSALSRPPAFINPHPQASAPLFQAFSHPPAPMPGPVSS